MLSPRSSYAGGCEQLLGQVADIRVRDFLLVVVEHEDQFLTRTDQPFGQAEATLHLARQLVARWDESRSVRLAVVFGEVELPLTIAAEDHDLSLVVR